MEKLKIAFDPVYNWDIKFFRDFIKEMILESDELDIYLVTTSTDTAFISKVTTESGIDSTKVFQEADNTLAVTRLQTIGAMIYLSYDYPLVTDVNENIPLTVQSAGNITGCQAIISNGLLDRNKSQPLYITHFQFWLNYINKSLNSGKKEGC